jgi:hypothetical protein
MATIKLLTVIILAGCSSTTGLGAPRDAGASDVLDSAPIDAERDVGEGEAAEDGASGDAPTTPVLAVSLDPTLDQPDDDVKVTSITSARLFDEMGVAKRDASLSLGSASFALQGLSAGDYFIEVNGDADDLVPTRIDDPTSSMMQTVGQKLRASYIGPPGQPTYRLNTYSAGQNESPVVKYSDGTTIPSEHPYVIYSFATSQLEIRLLGTGAALTSLPLPRCVGHAYDAADAWLLNTTSQDHHGDLFKADGGAATCRTCHWYGDTKKYAYGVISSTDGWCYKCHYGTGGSAAGFVDPTK